jgi:hypothetical protein
MAPTPRKKKTVGRTDIVVKKKPKKALLTGKIRKQIEEMARRRSGMHAAATGGCDPNAVCKFISLLAPPGPGTIPAEPYLTTLMNAINYLNGAVTAIESFLFDASHTEIPGYVPFFLDPQPGDPPEKGGTPPPPGFPPP